jgi:hypothetical protein
LLFVSLGSGVALLFGIKNFESMWQNGIKAILDAPDLEI